MIFAPYDTDEGGVPLGFTFDNLTCYDILECSIDTEPVYSDVINELFGIDKVPIFENKVFIRHKVRVKENGIRTSLIGAVIYQAINDIKRRGFPPQYFNFELSPD